MLYEVEYVLWEPECEKQTSFHFICDFCAWLPFQLPQLMLLAISCVANGFISKIT